MTEPENFEDDLFADLYDNDEEAAKPTAQPLPETKIEPAVVNGSHPIKSEDQNAGNEVATSDNQHSYKEEEQDDDEIDFNLGNGNPNDYGAQSHHDRESHGPGIKEDGKMFIGGLNWETTDQSLKDYFSQFGEVVECTVMRDGASGRSRGFGFLTFKDARTVNIVMVKEHYLDGKIIDPKRAIPRDEQERTSKIFVGGVSQEATEQDFKEYFMQFGRVIDATLMMDKDTGRPRGFGFVTFDSEAAVEACLEIPLEIHGKPIEVKKAQPRGNVREEEDRGGRNRFRKPDERDTFSNQGGQQQQGMGGMGGMGAGGMTPQLMAQYWQRMQAYFAMMQQQMAMGRGGAMNPAMMQQMQQMQAMQAMQAQMAGGNNAANMGARSQSPQGPQSPNVMQGMNPAMLAQMQQMQQMQAMQAMQGAGGPGAQAQAQGRPAFNAYEQQQFEQQKYEQQSRGQYRGSRDQSAGAYGGQQPTSWEGMYDDVPQPIQSGGGSVSGASGGAGGYGGGGGGGGGAGFGGAHRGGRGGSQTPSGPGPAPPAGAPTGPKNAGKPGANYRGGGRGGRGGFHPYSRG